VAVAPDPLLARTLRERIGGRWAISWPTYLVTTGLGLFALIAGEAASIRSAADVGLWVLLWSAGAATIGLALIIADRTFLRARHATPVAVPLVVAFDGLCGLLFGLVVSVGAGALALPTDQGLVQRTAIDTLLALWWGPTISYFFDYREQVARARVELVSEAVDLELARLQQGEIVALIDAELREEIGTELVPARERVELLLRADPSPTVRVALTASDWGQVSNLLRGTADDSVRPLSRRLWEQTEERYPPTPWWALPANIVRYQPFRPLAYALVDIVGTIAGLTATFGFGRALVLLAAGLCITLPVGVTANALMRRHPRRHTALFLAMIAVMQVSVPVRAALRNAWVPGSVTPAWVVAQVLAGIVVVLITSGFGAWRDKQAEQRSNLRSDLRADRIESIARSRQVALLAREAAQVLHGSVQSRLTACALAIERAATHDDQRALSLALVEALDALSADVPIRRDFTNGSVTAEVARKVALWEGFCAFEVTVDSSCKPPGLTATTIGRVVEGGIANAVRHGKATAMSITVECEADGRVRVLICDNGSGPAAGSPGLGSAFLTQVSRGDWSLTRTEGGSRLEVCVSATA